MSACRGKRRRRRLGCPVCCGTFLPTQDSRNSLACSNTACTRYLCLYLATAGDAYTTGRRAAGITHASAAAARTAAPSSTAATRGAAMPRSTAAGVGSCLLHCQPRIAACSPARGRITAAHALITVAAPPAAAAADDRVTRPFRFGLTVAASTSTTSRAPVPTSPEDALTGSLCSHSSDSSSPHGSVSAWQQLGCAPRQPMGGSVLRGSRLLQAGPLAGTPGISRGLWPPNEPPAGPAGAHQLLQVLGRACGGRLVPAPQDAHAHS